MRYGESAGLGPGITSSVFPSPAYCIRTKKQCALMHSLCPFGYWRWALSLSEFSTQARPSERGKGFSPAWCLGCVAVHWRSARWLSIFLAFCCSRRGTRGFSHYFSEKQVDEGKIPAKRPRVLRLPPIISLCLALPDVAAQRPHF